MNKKPALLLHYIVIIGLILSSCSVLPTDNQSGNPENGQSMKQAEVVFKVWVPENTPVDAVINLDILDEVTGLAIYPIRYTLSQSNGFLYEVHVPVNIGSMLKYRYSKLNGVSINENTSAGNSVRYRMVSINGPAIVEDVIYAWGDLPLTKPTGRIQGRILDETSNTGIGNIMVTAGGITTFTSSEGDYILEGLPIGTHNLVAYSIDGKYTLYQQGAMVAENATTPANIKIRPADLVTVTFITNTPADASGGLPIRMVGNLYQLGNTYSDVSAGFSTLDNRSPIMTVREDGSYAYSIKLPIGFDLRYKYSLGDGFWNAEHHSNGNFRLRQLIVPASDVVITDVIDTWSINKATPFVFRVTVPENTPAGDSVSIQLNPFDWTPPLEMWSLGNHQYIYVLYSPYQLLGDIAYRYCRNDQCNKSSAILVDKSVDSMVINAATEQRDITDVISSWSNFVTLESPAIVAVDISPKVHGFITGFELTADYSPNYQAHYTDAISSMYQSQSNLIMISPTWSVTHSSPPLFEPKPGHDMLKSDFEQIAQWVNDTSMPIAIYPQLNTSTMRISMDEWWLEAERSDGWWQSWFDRYRSYLMNYAVLANQVQAEAFVLNDGNIDPGLPSGLLPDATPSGVPGDAFSRWQRIIEDIRSVYAGDIYWAVYEDTNLENLSEIISLVDKVYYAELDTALISTENPSEDMAAYFDEIHLVYNNHSKPVIIGITFQENLSPEKQASLYQLVFEEINAQSWIGGVISSNFDPTIRLQDQSNSVFGKPAMEIIKYWYPKLTQ
ncbi:MAG: hypothetical protein JEZ00_09020 [Anaerolineaceae bacterium]|nr:hypothetical protein [Anaerolineaceae bacterium]